MVLRLPFLLDNTFTRYTVSRLVIFARSTDQSARYRTWEASDKDTDEA